MHPYFHLIALSFVPSIGHVHIKNLISYCGSAEEIFKQKALQLQKIPGIGPKTAHDIVSSQVFEAAEKEVCFIEKNNINALPYFDKRFPKRLAACSDSPFLIYTKGNCNLNSTKVIAIVGTRKASKYGRDFVDHLIEEMKSWELLVVSGMALGIDAQAHKMSVHHGLPTLGVLGHAFNRMYPPEHHSLAKSMLETNGALLTEYASQSTFLPSNFPMRNRIVAGMSDAVVVVESAQKGGAVITANIANSYHRDVFALPGKNRDTYSKGCNFLIKTYKAQLVESMQDIWQHMGWDIKENKPKKIQKELAFDLSEVEQKIMNALKDSEGVSLDNLMLGTQLSGSQIAASLLELELKGHINALPGNRFALS